MPDEQNQNTQLSEEEIEQGLEKLSGDIQKTKEDFVGQGDVIAEKIDKEFDALDQDLTDIDTAESEINADADGIIDDIAKEAENISNEEEI